MAAKNKVTAETGIEFLLRMRPSEDFALDDFGNFSTTDFVLLSAPCSYTKLSAVTRILAQAITPQKYGGLERNVLLLDMDYRLNMLTILETIEKKLKTLKVSNSKCDRVISKSPSFLKVIRSSNTLELTAVLASIRETVLEEEISVIVCDCTSLYTIDKQSFDYLYSTLTELPRYCNVTVIFSCYLLYEMLSIKFSKPADVYWSINKSPKCVGKYTVSLKRGFSTPVENDFVL